MHQPFRVLALAILTATLASFPAAQQFVENPRKPLFSIQGLYTAVVSGDVDGDGHPDLVFGNADNVWRANVLFLNDGRGSFKLTSSHLPWDAQLTYAVALVDVDRDGDLDLIVGNLFHGERDLRANRLLLNDGTGHFTDVSATRLPPNVDLTVAVAAGDVDGDGDPDLVFGNDGTNNRLLLNDGSGSFQDATAVQLPRDTDRTMGLSLADVDGDGDLDLVTANWESPGQQNRLYVNDGRGRFTDQSSRLPAVADATGVVLARDLDGDGDVDLVFGNQRPNPQNRILLNDGRGSFSDVPAALLPRDGRDTGSAACGDVDQDGHLDLVFGDGSPDFQLTLWLGDGRGGFGDAAGRLPPHSAWFSAVALADLDGDQDLDLVTGGHGPTQMFLNLARQIEGLAPPRVGATYDIGLFARASFASAGQLLVPFVNVREATPPLVIPPFGTWRVDPAGMVPLPVVPIPAPLGAALLQIPIPASAALVGLPVVVQGLALHDAALWRFTNVGFDPIVR